MPRKPAPPAPDYPCDGERRDLEPGQVVRCPNRVASRRPSATGTHWCPHKDCQSTKQRFLRERRKEAELDDFREVVHALVRDLAFKPRQRCEVCGLEDALPGWFHRRGVASAEPCPVSGPKGRGLPPGTLDQIHPDRAVRA